MAGPDSEPKLIADMFDAGRPERLGPPARPASTLAEGSGACAVVQIGQCPANVRCLM